MHMHTHMFAHVCMFHVCLCVLDVSCRLQSRLSSHCYRISNQDAKKRLVRVSSSPVCQLYVDFTRGDVQKADVISVKDGEEPGAT